MKHLILLFLLVIPLVTLSQHNEAEIRSFVAGATSNVWSTGYSSDANCNGQAKYTFASDVVRIRCLSGNTEVTVPWSVRVANPQAYQITIGNIEYKLVIKKFSDHDELVLRRPSPGVKIDPEITLTRNK